LLLLLELLLLKQCVTLTARNVHVLCRLPDRPRARPGGGQSPTHVTDDDRRQTTPTYDSVQNNTGPLGGPVINNKATCYKMKIQ